MLVRQGDLAGAERIAVRAAERLDGGLLAPPDGDRIGVFGSLLMNAASAAARQGSPGRAEDLLRVASAAATRSGVDRAEETGILGPRVAAMQAVDQVMDAGEPDRAMQLAMHVPDAAGPVPPFWESGHRMHLAAACADLERWGDVIEHLTAARALAPQWSRVQPLGHTVIGQLVEHTAVAVPNASRSWPHTTERASR